MSDPKKREDRDRSPTRPVFPPVQEIYAQRRTALQQKVTEDARTKATRVAAQKAAIKTWLETDYAHGKSKMFHSRNKSIESEVIDQLKAEGYNVEFDPWMGCNIYFKSNP